MAVEVCTVEFAYDLACPFAYLGSKQIEEVALRCGASLVWTPVLLGGLYHAVKRDKAGSATDGMPEGKKSILAADLRLQAQHLGVPLKSNDKHPVRTVAALRFLLAAPISLRPALTHTLFQAYWEKNEDVADDAVLSCIAQQFQLTLDLMHSKAAKEQLHQNTTRLAEMGAFGVPCFIVKGQLYWGQDRLFLVERALGRTAAKPRQIVWPPYKGPQPHTLVYHHDFSSPWSFLASIQVAEVAKACGAVLIYKPFLLGAVFKAIGTPIEPIKAVSAQRASYSRKDFEDWSTYLCVQAQWPSVLPIRSVLALRVAICNVDVTSAIYHAAWVDNKEIAQPSVLSQVLKEAGFNGEELLQQADSEPVKQELRRLTDELLELGGIGAPTFQVLDPDGQQVALLWGQDRLNLISDMLCGWRPILPNGKAWVQPTSRTPNIPLISNL